MRKYLIPFVLLFIFSCKETNPEKETGCQIVEETHQFDKENGFFDKQLFYNEIGKLDSVYSTMVWPMSDSRYGYAIKINYDGEMLSEIKIKYENYNYMLIMYPIYEVDLLKELVLKTDKGEQVSYFEFSYDEGDQVIDLVSDMFLYDFHFKYDDRGNIIELSSVDSDLNEVVGVITYSYDEQNNPYKEQSVENFILHSIVSEYRREFPYYLSKNNVIVSENLMTNEYNQEERQITSSYTYDENGYPTSCVQTYADSTQLFVTYQMSCN
ncbi:hypothetical protein V6R21_12195 [Limibacter armeniacum]|uniref:hypothetical protein n=1 Tax=Limibacter armeniacum TaxID=466084 RepID=UPI002FE61D78